MQTHTHTKCTETAQRVTFNYSSHAQQSLHAHKNNPALDFLNKLTWATSSSMGGIPGKPLLFFYSSTPAKYFTVFFLFSSSFTSLFSFRLHNLHLFIASSYVTLASPPISYFPPSILFFFLSYSLSPLLYFWTHRLISPRLSLFFLPSTSSPPLTVLPFCPLTLKKKTLMSIDLIGKRRKHVCVDVCMQMKCVCVCVSGLIALTVCT